MLNENQHPRNKSIMAAVVGMPNVGKSSLINYLLGFDLSAVTSKAQTTRNRFHCVFTVDQTEIILVDTPGVHSATQEINRRMNQEAFDAGQDAELNLLLIDLTRNYEQQLAFFRTKFEELSLNKIWLVFTKADLVPDLESKVAELNTLFQYMRHSWPIVERHFIVSSETGDGVHLLLGAMCDSADFGPHHYMDGALSNKNERFFVSEYIREQAFELLQDELPYEMAVVVEEFRDMREKEKKKKLSDDMPAPVAAVPVPEMVDASAPIETQSVFMEREPVVAHISANIIVNRPSQRAIVVGSKGSIIKEIGVRSRKKIESMLGGKVFLNLHVKVTPKWFRNNMILEQLGLPRAVDSKRVWRKRT